MYRPLLIALVLALGFSTVAPAQTVQQALKDVNVDKSWIYNDLNQGIAEAKRTGKPLLVALRCVPCKECKTLDEQVANPDANLARLLEQYICVRLVQTNGIDLSLFQYDFDISWSIVLMNADRTIYGRYGTRAHRDSVDDIHIEGFAKALQAALLLHQGYPGNKDTLEGKTPRKPKYATPEQMPSLKGKFNATLAAGNAQEVRRSCIHCHMVQEAGRAAYRLANEPIPYEVFYPYPMMDVLGVTLDAKQRATVKQVREGSVGDKAGFRAGDEIARLNGQPLISIADAQWVLHHAADGDTLTAEVRRDGKRLELSLKLPEGWRRSDISWRPSTWDLRRMALGGLVLEDLTDEERAQRKRPADRMAFRIKHMGQYGQHAAAKNAGFRNEDIIIAVDGHDRRMIESALIEELLRTRKNGERVDVTVLRGNQEVKLKLPMQ